VRHGDRLAYRYGKSERPVVSERITVPYRTASGGATRIFTVYRTHHGPIVRAEWGRYSESKRRYLEAQYPYITQGLVTKPETTPAIATNVGTPAPA